MPGKSHRVAARYAAQRRKRKSLHHARGQSLAAFRASDTPTIEPGPSKSQLATGYRYVGRDLRRIGIVAGGMFVILIVLTLALG